MIVVVDYGRGNLFSLGQALNHVGADFAVTDEPAALKNARRIILPGVGAFGDAAAGLRERGLTEPLVAAAAGGTPLLGICVGCQLLLTMGEEFGEHVGLGLIPGRVRRLPDPRPGDANAIRIPNVGWRPLQGTPGDPLLDPLGAGDMVYFVHSFAPMVDDPAHAAARLAVNGASIPVAVRRGTVYGVQFHPEKSGEVGLGILARFVTGDIG